MDNVLISDWNIWDFPDGSLDDWSNVKEKDTDANIYIYIEEKLQSLLFLKCTDLIHNTNYGADKKW